MIVNLQRQIEFNNSCDCKVDYVDLAEAIMWFAMWPVARLKKIFIHVGYPAVSIYEKKIHVHRLLMMYWLDRELDSSEYVHHKDGNRLNALKSNLELTMASEHQSLTNKGKKQSKTHILKRIDATTRKRYGHSIYENSELLKGDPQ